MVPIDQASQKVEAMLQNDSTTMATNQELAMLIKGIADMLPEKQKLVFILRDIEGMASEEVEAITEMTETSVKSNLYHARKRVREQLLRILQKERKTT